ncbi:hypothetical protein ACFX14_025849 [Malus domestica]
MSSKTHHCKTINCKTQELGFPTARILSASRSSVQSSSSEDAVAQVLHDQEEAREEDEAEPTHSSLDPHEDRQHHQVRIYETPFEFFFYFLHSIYLFCSWKFLPPAALIRRHAASGTTLSAGTGAAPSLDFEVDLSLLYIMVLVKILILRNSWKLFMFNQIGNFHGVP